MSHFPHIAFKLSPSADNSASISASVPTVMRRKTVDSRSVKIAHQDFPFPQRRKQCAGILFRMRRKQEICFDGSTKKTQFFQCLRTSLPGSDDAAAGILKIRPIPSQQPPLPGARRSSV